VEEGDRFPGNSDFAAVSRDELGRVFGTEGLAEAIFSVTPHQWSTPLRSGFGWHTVYVTARQPSQEAAFGDVRQTVRLDFLDAERDRRNAEAFAKLQASFRIVRE
jgi:parvulin-like peptidyl-prolyl isomerase